MSDNNTDELSESIARLGLASRDLTRSGNGAGAAYLDLADELREAIVADRFGSGNRLPTEAELVAATGLSRQTVRRAFQELVSEGIIYRVRGRGSFAVPGHGKYLRSFGSVDDLMALSQDTLLQVVEPLHIRASVDVADRLGISEEIVMAMSFLRLHDGVPFCFTRVHLPRELGEQILALPEMQRLSSPGARGRTTVIGLIERLGPIAIQGAQQDITAVAATSDVARLIDCEAGQPVLKIERLYWDRDGTPIEFAVNHFNPESYSYRLQLRGSASGTRQDRREHDAAGG